MLTVFCQGQSLTSDDVFHGCSVTADNPRVADARDDLGSLGMEKVAREDGLWTQKFN